MRRPVAWSYVLHFDAPLAHARHYIGATLDLRARLIRHATGNGCRITRALAQAGIEWRLGGVFQVSPVALWEAEKQAKRRHQGAELCDLCDGKARLLDAMRVDLDHITFPTTSRELRNAWAKLARTAANRTDPPAATTSIVRRARVRRNAESAGRYSQTEDGNATNARPR